MKSKNKKASAGDIVCLSELGKNKVAEIVKINCDKIFLRRRLFEMGLTQGVKIEIKKIAPLGDPVSIKLRGYELLLRRAELKNIEARVLK